jgi:transcriptional regulator with XRE-family HTH domain
MEVEELMVCGVPAEQEVLSRVAMNRPPVPSVGACIVWERLRSRLTQSALAAQLGISVSMLGRWERGERSVPPEWTEKVAQALGVTVEQLTALTKVNTRGFAYLIGPSTQSGPCKIGHSVSPAKRLNDLRQFARDWWGIAPPTKLKVLSKIETKDMFALEVLLQTYYRTKRVMGEWFNLSASEVIAFSIIADRLNSENGWQV